MFEHENMSKEEREKLYGAHYDSVRGFGQPEAAEPPRGQAETAPRETGSFAAKFGRFGLIVLLILAAGVAQTVVRHVFGPAARSRHSVETFDEAWKKVAKQFGEQWPHMKKKVVAEGVEEVKAEFQKQGYRLTEPDVKKLESLMEASIDGCDPERYFLNHKHTFLKKIGKSEEEFNRMAAAAHSEEEMESLKKLVRQASYDLGFEFGKSLRKPLADAVDRFVEYLAEQQKAGQNR